MNLSPSNKRFFVAFLNYVKEKKKIKEANEEIENPVIAETKIRKCSINLEL